MNNPYVEQELRQIENKLKALRPHFTKVGMAKIGTLLVDLTDLKNDVAPQDHIPTDENACHRGIHHNR